MSLLKFVAAFLSVFTMCLAPVAQGAAQKESQKQLISQFLKGSGLTTKKMTVAEFWRMIRHTQPEKNRHALDAWVGRHRDEMMPAVTATSFKDGQGREQTRLTMNSNGKSMSVTFVDDEEFQVKINEVKFKGNDFFDLSKTLSRVSKEDPAVKKETEARQSESFFRDDLVMSYAELVKLTAKQRAEYLYRLRLTMMSAQNLVAAAHGSQALNELNSKYEWVVKNFLGQDADAKAKATGSGKVVGACVVAGYISIYGSKGRNSCGGIDEGAKDLQGQIGSYGKSCPSSSRVPCNPLVYGFSGNGQPYCVPNASINDATNNCNQQSPLGGVNDKKRIIESYMKTALGKDVTLNPNEKGEISPEERAQIDGYLKALNGLVADGIALCDKSEYHKKIQSARPDQVSACEALRVRMMDLQTFAGVPTPPADIKPPMPPMNDCNAQKPGSILAADNKTCNCPMGTVESTLTKEDGSSGPACVPPNVPEAPKKAEKEEKTNWTPWLVGGALVAAGVGAYFLFKKDKKDTPLVPPTYTPPVPTTPTTPTICTAPAYLLNGVCQVPTNPDIPPVIVPPPPIVTNPPPPTTVPTEGGSGNSGTNSGGVR